MDSLKLRKVGNSVVVTIPVDVLDQYALKEGDSLRLDREAERITLTPQTTRESHIEVARRVMRKHRDALALLAK